MPSNIWPGQLRVDDVVTLRGESVVITEIEDRDFLITQNDPSVYGEHLLGHEGDLGTLAAYRPATPEDLAEDDIDPEADPDVDRAFRDYGVRNLPDAVRADLDRAWAASFAGETLGREWVWHSVVAVHLLTSEGYSTEAAITGVETFFEFDADPGFPGPGVLVDPFALDRMRSFAAAGDEDNDADYD